MGKLLMSVLCPHPPIIIKEVGGNETIKTEHTIKAMEKLASDIVIANPDAIIVITPHSYYHPDSFTVYSGKILEGGFSRFGAPQIKLTCKNDLDFIESINDTISDNFENMNKIPPEASLDHGTCVPLYFILKAGYKGKVIVINYSALSADKHILFGEKIAQAISKSDKNFVFIASGDLSHRLLPDAPAGYDPEAHKFDEIIAESIKNGQYINIINIDSALRIKAGECAYNSIMIALGVMDKKPLNNQVLSYEAPFGVGYLVASL
jgi:AmmeMemoRadiSam system protein B